MLQFRASNTRSVSPQRAAQEALEIAQGSDPIDFSVVLLNATVGHDLVALTEHVREAAPRARVLAASCAGVVGPAGPGESMHDVALMGIGGEGCVVATVDGLVGDTSFEKGAELARGLQGTPEPVHCVFLLASGIDIANDRVIAGMESVLGSEVTIFGATSSDQMQGIATFQAIDGVQHQHAAYADRKSTRLNSSHVSEYRMPSSA